MSSTPLPISPSPSQSGKAERYPPWHGIGVTWIWKILYILYCLEVGSFLVILPWLGIWDHNYLLYRLPAIQPLVANPFLKGGVLGLGIVNLVIGIQEIAHLKKRSRGLFPR